MKKVFLLLAALLFSASAQAQVVKLAKVEQANAAAAGVYAGKVKAVDHANLFFRAGGPCVPFSAVFYRESAPFVGVYNPKTRQVKLVPVKIGAVFDNQSVEISDGVSAGDFVVAAGGGAGRKAGHRQNRGGNPENGAD